MKKLKLHTDPHVNGPLRQHIKHQTEVDTNPCLLVQVLVLYYNLFLN